GEGHTSPAVTESRSQACDRWLGRNRGTLKRNRTGPPQDLIRRERQDPKHQMGHNLGASTHPYALPSEFLLQARIDSFNHSALTKTDLLMRVHDRRRLGTPFLPRDDWHVQMQLVANPEI